MGPVFAAHDFEWRARLEWDMSEVSELVRTAIDERVLHGCALVGEADRVEGFCFYAVAARRCLIGGFYVTPQVRSAAANSRLAHAVLEDIGRRPGVRRVETQSICFDTTGVEEVMEKAGFCAHERCFMRARALARDPDEHPDVVLRPWVDADFSRCAELIYRAYRGAVDPRINSQYGSRDGCADLLDALTTTPWCGRFDAGLTQVAQARDSRRILGLAVASRISTKVGHLGQVSVLPGVQGRGIGRTIVRGALAAAADNGLDALTLAVTSENTVACRLYEREGFETTLRFQVYCR
jgi:ribosomal protein S18 acetylase RimI-like enzyme